MYQETPPRRKQPSSTPETKLHATQLEKPDYEDIFSYQLRRHPLVERHDPQFFARGGMQVVYEIPKHPNIVVKVHYQWLKRNADYLTANAGHMSPQELEREMKKKAAMDLAEIRRRNRLLVQYFGKEHVVPSRFYVTKIPVTRKMLKHLWRDAKPPNVRTLWSIVTVQNKLEVVTEKAKPEDAPKYLSLSHRIAETSERVDPLTYEHVTRALVYQPPYRQIKNEVDLLDDFYLFHGTEALHKLFTAADRSKGLQKTIRAFVAASIRYSQDTGEILDIDPSGNIIFYKNQGQWTYKMLDTLYPKSYVIPRAIKILEELHKNPTYPGSVSDAGYFLNYARAINMLAYSFLARERLDCIPKKLKNRPILYLKTLQKALEKD